MLIGESLFIKKIQIVETLWLDEAGAGNDFAEIFVRCPKCNIRRPYQMQNN